MDWLAIPTWYGACVEWLWRRGFAIGFWETSAEKFLAQMREFNPSRDFYWIAGGDATSRKSGIGGPHVCVYLNDQLWHDPNPERTGIVNIHAAFLIDRRLRIVTSPELFQGRPVQ